MKTDNMFCVHTTAFYRRHNCLISLWACSSKQNIEPAIVPSTANCSRGFRCVLLASLNFFKLEMSRRKKQTTNARDKTDYFSWSDDEVELLLSSTMEYKTSKEMENIDWESCQSKYQDIHDKFVEHYPTPEEAKALGKEYPHSRTQMTKAILTSKLKTIR